MDFSSAVEKIMPAVESGSDEPFIFYRSHDGEWHCELMQNQFGETLDFVEGVKAQDPLAVTFTGHDFGHGSFSTVYDQILNDRLHAEYDISFAIGISEVELKALVGVVGESLCEFSSDVTDYLIMCERPLAMLYDMTPISLKSDHPYRSINAEKIEEFVSAIEHEVKVRLNNRQKQETLKGLEVGKNIVESSDKHIVEGYEERASIRLAGRIVILAENKDAEEPFMVVNCKWDNPFGVDEYYEAAVTTDYLEAMREFITREITLLESLEAQRSLSGLPFLTLTAADCIPNSMNEKLEGKVVVVKPEIVSPEYRSAEHQLGYCVGGFGANPNSRGNAVFLTRLYNGEERRYERHQIAGVIDPDKMPEWAKMKLAEFLAERDKEEKKKPSLLGNLKEAKKDVKGSDPSGNTHNKRKDMERD